MHTRGRYSAADLSIISPDGPREILEPPDYFNARELKEWNEVVGRLGSEFFPRECLVLAATFISISVALEAINRELSRFDKGLPRPGELRSYCELIKLRGPLVTQLALLATKLRLAPSTRNDRDRTTGQAKRAAQVHGRKPWEVEIESDEADPVN